MDIRLKVAGVLVAVGAGAIGACQAWQFVERHWDDIFALLIVALVVGVPLTMKIRSDFFKVG